MQRLVNHGFLIDALRSANHANVSRIFSFPNETHDLWEFVYVLNGTVGVAENDNVYRITEGQIIFHRPMEFHRIWSETKTGYEILIMSFHTDTNYLYPLGNGPINLPLSLQEEILEVYNNVRSGIIDVRAKEEEPSYSDTLIADLALRSLEVFLLKLMQHTTKSFYVPEEKNDPIAENYKIIMNVLHDNINKNLSVKDIAKLSNLSVSNLNKIFKKYTGSGVMHHFNRMKIIRAMKMFDENISMNEIVATLDFSSKSYFLKVFKRYTNLSPSEYKKYKIKSIRQ